MILKGQKWATKHTGENPPFFWAPQGKPLKNCGPHRNAKGPRGNFPVKGKIPVLKPPAKFEPTGYSSGNVE